MEQGAAWPGSTLCCSAFAWRGVVRAAAARLGLARHRSCIARTGCVHDLYGRGAGGCDCNGLRTGRWFHLERLAWLPTRRALLSLTRRNLMWCRATRHGSARRGGVRSECRFSRHCGWRCCDLACYEVVYWAWLHGRVRTSARARVCLCVRVRVRTRVSASECVFVCVVSVCVSARRHARVFASGCECARVRVGARGFTWTR